MGYAIKGGPTQLIKDYALQSYFSSTLLEQAVLAAPPGTPFISSTVDEYQHGGWGVGLTPQSESPVTFLFKMGTGAAGVPLTVKPGQFLFPFGQHQFTGFTFGLPNGWLGGGLANIIVMQDPDSDFRLTERTEVVFHRTRLKIQGNGAVNVAPNANWPIRFPWKNAINGSTTPATKQGLSAALNVNPTRTIMRLRLATVPAGGLSMRAMWFKVSEMDAASDGTFGALNTGSAAEDVFWPQFAASGITVTGGLTPAEYPMTTLDVPGAILGGDDASLVLVDTSAGQQLAGLFVDCVRYGYL